MMPPTTAPIRVSRVATGTLSNKPILTSSFDPNHRHDRSPTSWNARDHVRLIAPYVPAAALIDRDVIGEPSVAPIEDEQIARTRLAGAHPVAATPTYPSAGIRRVARKLRLRHDAALQHYVRNEYGAPRQSG